jgi:hypothetical protein
VNTTTTTTNTTTTNTTSSWKINAEFLTYNKSEVVGYSLTLVQKMGLKRSWLVSRNCHDRDGDLLRKATKTLLKCPTAMPTEYRTCGRI